MSENSKKYTCGNVNISITIKCPGFVEEDDDGASFEFDHLDFDSLDGDFGSASTDFFDDVEDEGDEADETDWDDYLETLDMQ